MKVIIVGGGISGLSTYLFLRKYCPQIKDITIYESYPPRTSAKANATFEELSTSTAIIGGGIGLSPNGARILRELNPDIYAAAKASGFPVEKFVFKSARGWRLHVGPTTDNYGKPGHPEGEEEVCIAMSRHGLWEALNGAMEKDTVVYRKVVSATKGGEGKKPTIVFEDGSEDSADLVIGADGVKSVVLKGIFGEGEEFEPQYEGQIGVGGFIDNAVPEEILEEKSMVFEFGRNGFFGYSAISPTQAMWWSTCQADGVPNETRMDPEALKAQLIARHGSWKDPHVHSLVEKSDVDSIYPVWQTPQLPNWGDHGLVVLGDAAHAINPTSGQGSSQAFEDAKCFTLVLSKFLAAGAEKSSKLTEQEVIELSIKTFHAVRSPRIKKIYERTKMMAGRKRDQTLPEEMFLCLLLWLMGKVPSVGKMLLGDVNKELYEWDMEGIVDKAVKKALEA